MTQSFHAKHGRECKLLFIRSGIQIVFCLEEFARRALNVRRNLRSEVFFVGELLFTDLKYLSLHPGSFLELSKALQELFYFPPLTQIEF